MRFRGILQSENSGKMSTWLTDAKRSGLYAMQRFARTLRRDIDEVKKRNHRTAEQWSDKRTNQPPQNPETSDVWPSRA